MTEKMPHAAPSPDASKHARKRTPEQMEADVDMELRRQQERGLKNEQGDFVTTAERYADLDQGIRAPASSGTMRVAERYEDDTDQKPTQAG